MADELSLAYVAPGLPVPLMQAWRDRPPPPLLDGRYEVVDEAYGTLVLASRYMDWPQKLTLVASQVGPVVLADACC
jgi:hypothetical protein